MSDAEASTALDEIKSLIKGAGTRCKAGPFIAGLPEADREAIGAAVAEDIEKAAIARFVIKRGFGYTEQSVVRHLVGKCACSR